MPSIIEHLNQHVPDLGSPAPTVPSRTIWIVSVDDGDPAFSLHNIPCASQLLAVALLRPKLIELVRKYDLGVIPSKYVERISNKLDEALLKGRDTFEYDEFTDDGGFVVTVTRTELVTHVP